MQLVADSRPALSLSGYPAGVPHRGISPRQVSITMRFHFTLSRINPDTPTIFVKIFYYRELSFFPGIKITAGRSTPELNPAQRAEYRILSKSTVVITVLICYTSCFAFPRRF
jgi:hypothetical protein